MHTIWSDFVGHSDFDTQGTRTGATYSYPTILATNAASNDFGNISCTILARNHLAIARSVATWQSRGCKEDAYYAGEIAALHSQ